MVGIGKQLKGAERIKELQHELQTSHSVMERNVIGWCTCLYFLEQVCAHTASFIHLKLFVASYGDGELKFYAFL